MEEDDIARLQFRRNGGADQRLVFRQVGAEELGFVEALGRERQRVRLRHEPERAVLYRLAAERDPRRNEIVALERPVARIAMPAGQAAVRRMLGHQAVVMRARQIRRLAEIQLHPAAHFRRRRPFGEQRIAHVSVEQTPHRMAARGVLRIRRARIFQIGFELGGRRGFGQLPASDFTQRLATRRRHEPAHDDIAGLAQLANLFLLRFQQRLIGHFQLTGVERVCMLAWDTLTAN